MVHRTSNITFAKNKNMGAAIETRKSTGKHWFWFVVWLGALVTLMFVYREFFWLALPGTVTSFARGMDLI